MAPARAAGSMQPLNGRAVAVAVLAPSTRLTKRNAQPFCWGTDDGGQSCQLEEVSSWRGGNPQFTACAMSLWNFFMGPADWACP